MKSDGRWHFRPEQGHVVPFLLADMLLRPFYCDTVISEQNRGLMELGKFAIGLHHYSSSIMWLVICRSSARSDETTTITVGDRINMAGITSTSSSDPLDIFKQAAMTFQSPPAIYQRHRLGLEDLPKVRREAEVILDNEMTIVHKYVLLCNTNLAA